MMRIFRIIGAVSLLLIIGILAIPTIIIGLQGGFRAKEVLNRREPTLNLHLVITKKMSLPANEWVDPSITLRMELRELSSGKLLDKAQIKLFEDSEFQSPRTQWSSNGVLISRFNRRSEQEVSLKK